MIISEDIERAEKILTLTSGAGQAPNIMYQQANVDREAFEGFAAKMRDMCYAHFPSMDPRFEPTLNTLMMHSFLVGTMCGRADVRNKA